MISAGYKKKRALFPLLFAGVAACAAPPPSEETPAPPELQLTGVTYRFYEGSQTSVTGTAAHLTYLNETGAVAATDVSAISHDAQLGDIEARAPRASGDLFTKKALFQGGLHLKDAAGGEAFTESALFDARRRLASGEDPVDFRGEGFDSHATAGFSLDFKGDRVLHLRGPVFTQISEL